MSNYERKNLIIIYIIIIYIFKYGMDVQADVMEVQEEGVQRKLNRLFVSQNVQPNSFEQVI